jgi:hypothetical protein
MLTNKPEFPELDEWTRMSDEEQDALLTRMESARRRIPWLFWSVCSAGLVVIAWALFARLS